MEHGSFSYDRSPALGQEADRLRDCIAENAARFYEPREGRILSFGGFRFEPFSADDNRVYRASGSSSWFVKFPSRGRVEKVRHELAGARAVELGIGDDPSYRHPDAIRISLDPPFTLYAAVSGIRFNSSLYRNCLAIFRDADSGRWGPFTNFGRSLARFHSFESDESFRSPSDQRRYLLGDISDCQDRDPLIDAIAQWAEADHTNDADAWIHGNIKSRDVLVARDNRISLIDFEACGLGSPYVDLANPCADMVLLQCLPIFPWRRARKAMALFVESYAAVRSIDTSALARHVAIQMFRYYARNASGRVRSPTIMRIPLRRRTLEALMWSFLEAQYARAFAHVGIW